MIELCLNLPESRELDFELPADVAELLFNSRKNDGSRWRRPCGAAFSLLPALSVLATFAVLATLAAFPTLAPFFVLGLFSALAVRAFRAPRADRL